LRHPLTETTTGWYLWCGEEFSSDASFFEPVHTAHIYDDHPQIQVFLGLPPGYRFLWTESFAEVWFDPSLLEI
jgi:hypothetical protein